MINVELTKSLRWKGRGGTFFHYNAGKIESGGFNRKVLIRQMSSKHTHFFKKQRQSKSLITKTLVQKTWHFNSSKHMYTIFFLQFCQK